MSTNTDGNIKPCAMNLSQLAVLYKVSPRTFKKWLKKKGIPMPEDTYSFMPIEVKRIFEEIGEP